MYNVPRKLIDVLQGIVSVLENTFLDSSTVERPAVNR
jgi:hypothetical protein